MHVKVGATILPHTKQIIPIHDLSIPHSRDFLFQLDKVSFPLSAHLIDADVVGLPIENNTSKPIYISRNFRLGRVQELTYPNGLRLHSKEAELAKQTPYLQHRKAWLNKVVGAFYSAYEEQQLEGNVPLPAAIEMDVVLPNGVTIYRSCSQAVAKLSRFVTEYDSIWHDKGFAKLPEENWMNILLKSDWESRISGKAKVYPLSNKDKELVDKTSDELHELGRMSWSTDATPFSYPVFCVWKTQNGKRKDRVVVDIRGLNAISQPDAYPSRYYFYCPQLSLHLSGGLHLIFLSVTCSSGT